MQFAMSHDAVPADRPAEAHEPSAAKQRRVATTATLLAVALCAILAKGHLIEAGTSSHNAAVAQNAGTTPVTIVAPEFCKDQTWPYIDSRCLRRVAPDTPQATVPPATTTAAAAAPAPSGGSAKTVAATPPTAETTVAQTTVATNAAPAAAAPNPTDTQDQATQSQVMQSVFPAAAAPDTSTYPATNAYTRASNSPQRRRSEHWNNHSGFFGFRF
jgi:hypothetical protein